MVNGGPGNDSLRGFEGNDSLDGGAGNDLLEGDIGGDRLYGRAGQDVLVGGSGFDQIYGSTGADLIYGGQLIDDDDELLKAMAALWFDFDFDSALNDLMDNSDDDTSGDTLHGEGDGDWYLTDAMDAFKLASEKNSPNTVVPRV
jgi:Ca2+-binding RTX toxin-like protein